MTFSAFAPFLAGLLATVGTYLAVRHNKSGRIVTSEAADLWKESTALRTDLRTELTQLRRIVTEQLQMIALQESQIVSLEGRHEECIKMLESVRAELRAIRDVQAGP